MPSSTQPATLTAALLQGEARGDAELVFDLRSGSVRLGSDELVDRAARAAVVLAGRGIGPGEAVGLLGPNRPEWAVWALGTWLAGGTVVPLQFPLALGDRAAAAERLGTLVGAASCRTVVGDPDLLSLVPEDTRLPWDAPLPVSAPVTADLTHPDDIAVIQFSSGSTAAPKGAALTHRAVLAQVAGIELRLGPTADRMVGWAPFFHDLGLFLYLIFPMASGRRVDVLPTERFARNPTRWFELATSASATFTLAPASAYCLAIHLASRRPSAIDLSSLEAAWFGAEPVDPRSADLVLAATQRLRLRSTALGVGYGLAESVLSVTSSRPGAGLEFDRVDTNELAAHGRAAPATGPSSRRIVSCGVPLLHTEVRIVDDRATVADRDVGEIEVRGPSTMSGYVGADLQDPFHDGWLRTGDLGYLSGGELFVTGRAKDMIIVMGQNHYPEDFEWAAQRVPAVRPGRCVAFSRPDTEQVVVVVETASRHDSDELRTAVQQAIVDAVGPVGALVLLVPRGTVPRTTSGKVRRSALRDAYRAGELDGFGGKATSAKRVP